MTKKTKNTTLSRLKTLEQLENEIWPSVIDVTFMVSTCHALRKKPIHEYDIEDLRLMISQRIGLTYLIPEALRKLDQNLFLAGHFYPGDLFMATLAVGLNYWSFNPDHIAWMCLIADKNNAVLKKKYPSLYSEYTDWLEQMKED